MQANQGNAIVSIKGDSDTFLSSMFTQGIDSISFILSEKQHINASKATLILENPIYYPSQDNLRYPVQQVFLRLSKANKVIKEQKCLVTASIKLKRDFSIQGNIIHIGMKSSDCPEMNMEVVNYLNSQDIKTFQVIFGFVFLASL